MNTVLIPYGIQNEQSDIRAHVGVLAQRVFVYRTRVMVDLLLKQNFPTAFATQEGANGQWTGKGKLVPIHAVPRMYIIPCPKFSWHTFPARTDTTSARGDKAVELICLLLKHGAFPLWVRASESKDAKIQINGTDIVVVANQRIQVKCDYNAGLRSWHPECTGNLFVQTAECNPFKRT